MLNLNLDPIFLSRIQFAFTMSFHIIFPAFTIGLASWLVVIEALWLKTKKPVYKALYMFWVKIFAIAFGMGVVSGIVMSYQFGTNWAGFSAKIGNVLGPLLGFEVLTAFFLESSFLGIMLFGWNRVSEKMHFVSTVIVAVGTLISAFWILSANSWMHTPAGYAFQQGVFYPVDWLKIIFNPSFPYRFIHMITAAYLTTAFVVGGVGSWYLWKKEHLQCAKIMLVMAMLMAFFVAPLQILFGDAHGLNTLKHQPMKVAAMEALWNTQKGAPLVLFALPDQARSENKYALQIPKLSSLILTHTLEGEVKGLNEIPRNQQPPVRTVFFAFRIMVGIGFLMVLTGLIGMGLYFRKRLFVSRAFQCWCMGMAPSGFIAVLCGWFVTEVGRQPYIVYGLMRTREASSPVLGEYILLSIIAFVIIYTFVFGAGVHYILKLIKKGPEQIIGEETQILGQQNAVVITRLSTHEGKFL
jgi:cytochrome d ubiquinol oxidase subunit I